MTASVPRLGFTARLVLALVAAVVTTALAVGAISVFLVRGSLQESLREDAIADARATATTIADDADLPAMPDDDAITASGVVDRVLAQGVDGLWMEVDGHAPFVSSIAMLEGPDAVSATFRETVQRGELAWEFTSIGQAPVLVTAGQRPADGTAFFLVTSTATIDDVTRQLGRTILLVAATVAGLGSLVAWALADRLLQPVTRAAAAAHRMAAGHLDTDLDTGSDAFGRLGSAFNTMAASLRTTIARLEGARDRERRFVADASHDLRTPVTGLVNAAAMLTARLDTAHVDEDTRRIASALDREATNLAHLVDGLLEVSRAGGAHEPEAASPIDVTAFLGTLVAARVPGARLVSTLAAPLAVPATTFERIIGNVLDNARIHAAGRDVVVTATLLPPRPQDTGVTRWLHVEVADRGPGIPPDRLDAVFDRLTTGSSARGTGSGLGLAIARGHARQLGGDVTAHTRDGGGTRILVVVAVAQLLHGREDAETGHPHDGG